VNKLEAVAPWCSIDISSGNLTVALEPFNCFDAETYADELAMDEPVEFREDQRSMLSCPLVRVSHTDLTGSKCRQMDTAISLC
jgi:WD repeat-containing protein 48